MKRIMQQSRLRQIHALWVGLIFVLSLPLTVQATTNLWSAAASPEQPHVYQVATLLTSGMVLVAGGSPGEMGDGLQAGISSSSPLYNGPNNTWSENYTFPGSIGPTATRLPSGQVLVTGGRGTQGDLARALLYDPASNTWSAAASLATAHASHTATLLPSGQVLVVAGSNNTIYQVNAERYDPASNTWSAAASLASARAYHTATLLPFGQVLVVGGGQRSATPGSNGYYYMQGITSAELFSTDVIYRNGFAGP